MNWAFLILSVLTLASAVAAMALRRLVHCALALALSFVGLAGLYLQLGAEFVGFAQILVYVGAVAVLVVFAILLTRGGTTSPQGRGAPSWPWGVGVAGAVGATLLAAILSSARIGGPAPEPPAATVQQLGVRLMTDYVLPLEVIGLLLTVALIGGVLLAMPDSRGEE